MRRVIVHGQFPLACTEVNQLTESPGPDVEEAWCLEIRRRVAAYERGEAVLYDVEVVMTEAKQLAR